MAEYSGSVAFFDIGNTLASVRVSADGTDVLNLVAYPDVPPVLEDLRREGIRLGILSDRGAIPEDRINAALDAAGLLSFFDRQLILYGPKNSTLLFEQAALAAQNGTDGRPPLLFVGEDATERSFARLADFLVAPHPSLARAVLGRLSPLRYLRVRVDPAVANGADWRSLLREQPLVPLHAAVHHGRPPSDESVELYAVADSATALELDDLGFSVDRLGEENEPLTTDLYLLRDDQQNESGFGSAVGNSFDHFAGDRSARRVLSSTQEGLFVAMPAGRSVESYHFARAHHGHNLKLQASPMLLAARADGTGPSGAAAPAPWHVHVEDGLNADALGLTPQEQELIESHITTERIGHEVDRYTGAHPASGDVTIRSRHIHHPDNASAIRTLLDDLTAAGAGRLTARTHRFIHEGRPYDNVEAVLPGSGLPGVVLVTAHMDSTGARQPGYRAQVDPAPGADDDCSGVAGVLCAVRAILALEAEEAGAPRREVRFVFFNAEEHGLVGSHAYALDQARLGSDIVAVLQMDMIGYDVEQPRAFELHAGFTPSTDVQTRSIRLAELIAATARQISPSLPAPQIYPGSDDGHDPAEHRSDHYSFQLHGYTACLVSEDLFAGPGPVSNLEPNPNYHLPADRTINSVYARDIARAATAAAWISTTR